METPQQGQTASVRSQTENSSDGKPAFTNVEYTAAQVSLYRFAGAFSKVKSGVAAKSGVAELSELLPPSSRTTPGWPGYQEKGLLYDPTYDYLIINTIMTREQQEDQLQRWCNQGGQSMMAGRTLSIDEQLLDAVKGAGAPPLEDLKAAPIRQVVLLGAGLDCRAWRLPWPQGVTVFEVDTGSAEPLKQRLFGNLPVKASRRVFCKADLAEPGALIKALQEAGHDSSAPTAWLAEGLLGYLSRRTHLALFTTLYNLSAPGSFLLATAAPSPQMRREAAQQNFKLHHQVFEDVEHTCRRVARCGWTNASIRSTEELQATYDLACKQPQIRAYKTKAGTAPPVRQGFGIGPIHCTIS